MGTNVSYNHGIKTAEDYATKKAEYNQKINQAKIDKACTFALTGGVLGGVSSFGGAALGNWTAEGLSYVLPNKGKLAEKLQIALNGEEGWFGTIKQPWLRYGLMGLGGLVCGIAGAYTAHSLADKCEKQDIEKINKEYEYLQKYVKKYEMSVEA